MGNATEATSEDDPATTPNCAAKESWKQRRGSKLGPWHPTLPGGLTEFLNSQKGRETLELKTPPPAISGGGVICRETA